MAGVGFIAWLEKGSIEGVEMEIMMGRRKGLMMVSGDV